MAEHTQAEDEPFIGIGAPGGILLRRQAQHAGSDLIVWPVAKRFELLYAHHDVSQHAHGGGSKLYELISRHVWDPGLKRDFADYVRNCDRCSHRKKALG